MAQKRNPICFIAMAFGRDDSEALFQNSILPVLRRNKVTPVIINRHQSNDDLNIQIIEQLRNADFCIADLTYTRPSVYYEAGFAQRSIPVIYTVRKDHLNKGQPEELRVHFDLQMKPIIDWKSPSDESFSSRLEKRLKATILREWQRNNNVNRREEMDIEKFDGLTLRDRLILLRRRAMYSMRGLGIGISAWTPGPLSLASGWHGRKWIVNGTLNHLFACLIKGKRAFVIALHSYGAITGRELLDLERYYGRTTFLRSYDSRLDGLESITLNNIVMCLKTMNSRQIERVFPDYTPIEKSRSYARSGYELLDTARIELAFSFLSPISSSLHLKTQLNNLIEQELKTQKWDERVSSKISADW